jgi:SpoIID/LytB domain protein
VDLVPRKRGVSGRLLELEVVGDQKRFVISRELPIRQALSRTTLYSAACYFKKEGGMKDLPARFVIKGAGWGHGVGMCQVGAAMMAASGKKVDEILSHYYQGIVLEVLYD